MLVSYRRVPKSSSTSPQLTSAKPPSLAEASRPQRPVLHKSASDSPRSSPSGALSDPRDQQPGDTDVEEAELPEVALDYNRHIIPQWLLRGTRNRSMSHSAASSSRPVDRRLRRPHLNGMTASSPDLGMSTSRADHFSCPPPQRLASSRLALSHTADEFDNRTPMNSPRVPCVPMSAHGSLSPNSALQPTWFGGTGSTEVRDGLVAWAGQVRRVKCEGHNVWLVCLDRELRDFWT